MPEMIRRFDPQDDAKPCVLLVDGEQDIQTALCMKLRNAGFEIVTATTAHEALRIVESQSLVMVVIEPKLVDMNGIKLGALVRETGKAPFMFLTSGSPKNYQEAAVCAGAITILSKRSHPDDLVTQIELAIKQAQAFADTCTLNENLTRKLVNTEKREALVGAYMEIWGENRDSVRERLVKFARSRRISLDVIADAHSQHCVEAAAVRAELSRKLASIQPDIIAELGRFYRQSTDEMEPPAPRRRALAQTDRPRAAPPPG